MKFAICNECFDDWPVEKVLEYAGRLGYDGVELAPFKLCDSVLEISDVERQRLRDAAARVGVEIIGLHWLLISPRGLHITHPDAAVRGRTSDYFHALIDFCGDLGGKIMVIGSPKNRNVVPPATPESAWEHARGLFHGCCDHAAERDVALCIEPLPARLTDMINTTEEALRLAVEIAHPYFKIILDVYALSGGGENIPAAIRRCGARLAHFHANDDNGGCPGSGRADYAAIMATLRATGYEGYMSGEVFDFSPGGEKIAAVTLEFLRGQCI